MEVSEFISDVGGGEILPPSSKKAQSDFLRDHHFGENKKTAMTVFPE